MISASLITLIIDIVALVFILSGFLFGIIRGLKGSVNRLLLILIAAVAALILTKLLSGTILNISIPFFKDGGGQAMSINAYLEKFLSSYKLTDTITLANFTLTIKGATTLIKLVANLVMFLVFFTILRFITYIIYLIFFRTKKQKFTDGSSITPKKKRWWGSLVGAVQGVCIFILVFIPLSGISSVCADMQKTAAAAETNSNAGIIETFVPEQYREYVNCYENSIFNKVVGITKVDELIFNTLTTSTIEDVEISFRHEVVNANDIVKTLNKFELIDAAKDKNTLKDKFNSLNEDQIGEIVKDIFNKGTNFGIIKFALIDGSNVLAEYLEVETRLKVSDIDWKLESELLGGAATDLICASRPIISNAIEGKTVLTTEMLGDGSINYSLLGRGVNKLTSLKLVKTTFNPLIKKLLSLDTVKNFGNDYGIDLSSLAIENIDFEKTFGTIGGLVKIAVKIKGNNKIDFDSLASEDLSELINQVKDVPELKDELNKVAIKTIEEQLGVEIENSDDFDLFGNDELIETTTKTIDALSAVETDGDINAEQANDILKNFENLSTTDETTQTMIDVVSKACGVEEDLPSVSDTKNIASKLNTFVSASDADGVDMAQDLVEAFNNNSSFIQILKFKNNKYLISATKYANLNDEALAYDALNGTTNAGEIMKLFTVIEA